MKTVNNVEYTIDPETGKFNSLIVNGKSKGLRDINKAMTASYWKLFSGAGVGRNPFSGVEVPLNAFELSIYNFCLNWYARYERGDMSLPIQVYDSMKYLLLAINSNAYMDLLD